MCFLLCVFIEMGEVGLKVYHGETLLGELDVITESIGGFGKFTNNEIRIHHFSQTSERCSPLSVLLTISASAVRCKLESSCSVRQPALIDLHSNCFYELKVENLFFYGF